MDARRVLAGAALRDPAAFGRATADGRLGPLLYRSAFARRLIIPQIGRRIFASDAASSRELRDALPATLDRIDGWIAGGILGGERPNAADYMVAPSLARMLYDAELEPLFAGRPALDLVDRLLPAPA